MSKQTSNFNEKARSIRLKNRTGTGECSMSEKAKNEVYRLKTDGFHGELFRPEQDSYPGKALICFSGSDGRFEWSRTLAQIFQSHGLTALALAYVMEEGLPRAFYHVPIDPLEAAAERVIAIQDRAKHNLPPYAYGVCKIFVLCSVTGGQFQENIETIGYGYFEENDLPELAEEKNNGEQIRMCFQAYRAGEAWRTLLD